MKILIVGGGTAGLICANILKKFLNADIDIVRSEKIGIVGVGEGSTEHFRDFIEFVGIDQYDLIRECDATYKSGIMFDEWTEKPYLHHVGYPFNSVFGQYSYAYAKQISDNEEFLSSKMLWENKVEQYFLNKPEEFPFNQYHFNTYKLNDFLSKFSKEK